MTAPSGTSRARSETAIQDRLSATLDAIKRAPEDARQAAQDRARQKVELVREQLKLIRELYAENPEEMAKALRTLVKELKAALKAYKEAGGNTAQMQAGMMGVIAAPAQPSGTDQSSLENQTAPDMAHDHPHEAQPGTTPPSAAEGDEEGLGEATVSEAGADTEHDTPLPLPTASASLNSLTAQQGQLMGDRDFLDSVDGLSRKIRDLFETAKIKAKFMAQDEERHEAFKALNEDLEDLEDHVQDSMSDTQSSLNAVTLEIKMIERGTLSLPTALSSASLVDVRA